ncbi:MAG: S8 family serine peptidase [Kiritimatiellales bacterium]|nr:S8 family serine peptidase [Kiritimatiellales bacterium]
MATRLMLLTCSVFLALSAVASDMVSLAGTDSDASRDINAADRLDPDLARALARRSPVPVVILCRTQLLDQPGGFERFCAAHDHDRRSTLRQRTIETLKSIAGSGEQKAVLRAMKNPDAATKLWIVNAVAATLSPEEIKALEVLPEVEYIYMGQRPRNPPSGPQRLSEVVRPAKPRPFATGKRMIPWNLKKIGADRVWSDLEITGEGAVVALLDSGANYAHPDLRNNLWINAGEVPNNGKDDDHNGLVDDYYGYDFTANSCEVRATGPKQHGTWTAGIIAGDGTGGILTGIAPRAHLMLLKANGTVAAAQAYQYALENGADVMNMSFSIPGLGQERGFWRLMAEQTVAAGLVLVSGCGNFQQTEQIPVQIRIPEGIPCVIGAGGLDEDLEVPFFCSLGPVEWQSVKLYGDYPLPDGLVKPDVCGFTGPGYPLLAAADEGYIDPNDRIKGNSFSSPHIAGVAALMLSAAPELPAWKIKTLLEHTAKDLDAPGKDNRTGAGLAQAFEAVCAARDAARVVQMDGRAGASAPTGPGQPTP